jgi:hypothetical protein
MYANYVLKKLVVNRESVVYNSGHRQIFLWKNAFEARHHHRSRVFAFTLGRSMQPANQPTKQEVRDWLKEVIASREPPPTPEATKQRLWHPSAHAIELRSKALP